jgi:hypothetical protein
VIEILTGDVRKVKRGSVTLLLSRDDDEKEIRAKKRSRPFGRLRAPGASREALVEDYFAGAAPRIFASVAFTRPA